MKLLLKIILKSKKHLLLLFFTLISMLVLTVANQLEIFSVGLLTQKGPDFFEVFGEVKEGSLTAASEVSQEDIAKRWSLIADKETGLVTPSSTNSFLEREKRHDLFYKGSSFFDKTFGFTKNLRNLAFMIVVVALFKAFALFFQRFTTKLVAIRVSQELRQAYFEHVQKLPLSFYQKHPIGGLSSRVVSDSSFIAESLNSCLTNYIQTPFTAISTFILCLLTSWQLTLIIFLGLPLIVFPIIFLAKRIKRISKQIQKNQENFTSLLLDFLAGIQTVKLFSMESFSLKKYGEQNDGMAKLAKRSARYDVSSRPIIHTIGMFFLATALIAGLYVFNMNLSEVIVYCGFLYIFYEPIKKFAEENGNIQKGVAAAERMFEVMSIEPEIQDPPNAVQLHQFSDSIELEGVWFKYRDEDWVIKDVSFSCKKGQKVGIVGATGAGKSTIAQLIPRLYDVQKGVIKIDGIPIQNYTQKSLREHISFVSQKPFLFLDTVAANISYGNHYTLEEVEHAAKQAHADEYICKLPEGYLTPLDEAGKNLSGGQQQRLAIARALFKKAPILILDEATSALDGLSENLIKKALNSLHGSVTQIIIAHRLSTIEDADKIIVLQDGKKIAEGTKEELLQNCPTFRNMWDALHTAQ